MFPYYTLQLRTLGLSLDDAALIGLFKFFNLSWSILTVTFLWGTCDIIIIIYILLGGICPILAFICGPLLGYVGDKLGFKTVLITIVLLKEEVQNDIKK